jgi:hypothetical protein
LTPLTSEYVFEWCTTKKFPKHIFGVAERERETAENVKFVLVMVATMSMVVVTFAITHQTIFAVLVVDATFLLCEKFTNEIASVLQIVSYLHKVFSKIHR